MNNVKSYRSKSKAVTVFYALAVLNMIGCNGGMIGTGSGPTNSIYEFEHLPDRISPDMPETLQNDDALPPSEDNKGFDFSPRIQSDEAIPLSQQNNGFDISSRNQNDEPEQSGGWRALARELTQVAVTRFEIELSSAIIDLAFDTIVKECAEKLIDCTIPADQIRVTVTQELVNHWLNDHVAVAQSLSTVYGVDIVAESIEQTNVEINSMLNNEVVLGETHYSQMDSAPYDHVVRTSLSNSEDKIVEYNPLFLGYVPLFRGDKTFTARWHDDGQVAKFTFDEHIPVNSTREYFYQNNVPSELVVLNHNYVIGNQDDFDNGFYASILGNDSTQAGVLVRAGSMGDSHELPGLDRQFYDVFEGQLDNDGGYSTMDAYTYDLTEEQNLFRRYRNRQTYDTGGFLLAGERCDFRISGEFGADCDDNVFDSFGPEGSQITDSVHYFAPGEFDSLASVRDAIRWHVTGVPSEIKSFAVISADSQFDLSESKVLCLGLQIAASDTDVFCTATDEQLENTVIVEHFNRKPTRVIPTAKLEQIQ